MRACLQVQPFRHFRFLPPLKFPDGHLLSGSAAAMVLEAVVVCVDNSEWMRNGDYAPSRLHAQQARLAWGSLFPLWPRPSVAACAPLVRASAADAPHRALSRVARGRTR